MLTSALLTALFLAAPVGSSEEAKQVAPYVVLVTEEDQSAQVLFERYPELATSFDELAKFNLLRPGHAIEVSADMLASDRILAKVASFFGEAEVKRAFDGRYIPLVRNLLLREGDQLRTWRGAGVRVLFDDGNYVFLKGQSRARLVALGNKKSATTSRLQIDLDEGSIWSEIEHPIGGRYEIRTATANTIIRGTEFRVKVEPDATRLEVLSGEVELSVGDQQFSVGAQRGALASATNDTPATAPLPPAPELVAPVSEEVIRAGSFDQVFRWTPLPAAEAYVLQVARDRDFFDIAVERRTGPDASVRIQSLEAGTYFWRVSTIDANGFESSPSTRRYFVHVEQNP